MTFEEYEIAWRKDLAERMRERMDDEELVLWLARLELSILAWEDLIMNGTGEPGGFTGLLQHIKRD